MSISLRLTVMNFMQFFVWGAWLISFSAYTSETLGFTGLQIGSIYGTMGVASLFMPGLMGIVADRWVNAERLYGILHLTGAALLVWAATVQDYQTLYWIMLLNAMVYMPTIALNNTISFRVLEQQGMNFIRKFPPIRVWGTIGFIAAMWCTDLSGSNLTVGQLYISAAAAVFLGLYGFSLPACPPSRDVTRRTLAEALGLDAFVLFRRAQMVVFFLCAMLLGGALQITNAFGGAFLADFAGTYPDSFGVRNSNILISISQISETLFILTIPFFLQRFGIKVVMVIAIFAWVLRFGLFAYGDPGPGLWMLVLSMVVYGMAFDFFNISGAMYVNLEANARIRASAQGLFMVMTNGIGAFLGTMVAGAVVDHYTVAGVRDWQSIWLAFAGYALVLGILFPFVFRYRHDAARMAAAATAH
jgi:MFS transporter, NHS family, xanthosine permease